MLADSKKDTINKGPNAIEKGDKKFDQADIIKIYNKLNREKIRSQPLNPFVASLYKHSGPVG